MSNGASDPHTPDQRKKGQSKYRVRLVKMTVSRTKQKDGTHHERRPFLVSV